MHKVCSFNFQIQYMKNNSVPHGISFNAVLKILGEAFKSLFQSSNKKEFRRLKDFITS